MKVFVRHWLSTDWASALSSTGLRLVSWSPSCAQFKQRGSSRVSAKWVSAGLVWDLWSTECLRLGLGI